MIKPHTKKWIKTNVLVDAGIANILEALNNFTQCHTIESCQKSENEFAYIVFTYGDYEKNQWENISMFVFSFLGPALIKEFNENINLSVRINSFGNILGELLFNKTISDNLYKTLIKLKRLDGKCGGC